MAEPWNPPTPNGWDFYAPPKPAPPPPKPAPKAAARLVPIAGMGDTAAVSKVETLISRVIQPAIRANLSWTRGILAEALGGAPRSVNGHAKPAEAVRIFEFVKSRMRYVNDPTGRELFTALPVSWGRKIGDCDDFAALLAALFSAAGIPARLRIVQTPKATGWSHIYTMAQIGGTWRAFDATVQPPAGWECARTRFRDFEVKP